ncbi:protein phosphatase 2C domain containing protein [Reticulomyxa filosa]|uniref:Protein phosphatase 2C domain containing protein n=1 Tax=Reticulomyxa filosa TaxID=46433 RepID=X6L7I8_RETFI|nr:protein phosphatase 2C domain containing protein [Reticulomyxa filosa]|eukprot:ETN97787.1 protein phosphatase 2C domain containing protein [Reticulomyxa filosa]
MFLFFFKKMKNYFNLGKRKWMEKLGKKVIGKENELEKGGKRKHRKGEKKIRKGEKKVDKNEKILKNEEKNKIKKEDNLKKRKY